MQKRIATVLNKKGTKRDCLIQTHPHPIPQLRKSADSGGPPDSGYAHGLGCLHNGYRGNPETLPHAGYGSEIFRGSQGRLRDDESSCLLLIP